MVKSGLEGRFATAMTKALNDHGLSIEDTRVKLGVSYEHVRKLVAGVAYPSRWLLKEICSLLELNYEDMNQLVVADRIENKWGGIPHQLVGQHPELSLMAPLWDNLTKEQKDMIRSTVKNFATQNAKVMARAS